MRRSTLRRINGLSHWESAVPRCHRRVWRLRNSGRVFIVGTVSVGGVWLHALRVQKNHLAYFLSIQRRVGYPRWLATLLVC